MYQEHFGLSRRPFVETTDPAAYVELPSRDAALRRLRYGLEQAQGPVVLYGPPGTGKSIAARKLALEMQTTPLFVSFPSLPAADLLALLLAELVGDSDPPPPPSVVVRRLRDALAQTVRRGHRHLLVVDEAHLIRDPATFDVLHLLLNFATAGPPDLALVLVGDTELLLRLPAGLGERLVARSLLAPLSPAETTGYVLGRLAAAGASQPLFTTEALDTLHRGSDGIPRRINLLADLALLIAYARGEPHADAKTVSIAASELFPDPLAA